MGKAETKQILEKVIKYCDTLVKGIIDNEHNLQGMVGMVGNMPMLIDKVISVIPKALYTQDVEEYYNFFKDYSKQCSNIEMLNNNKDNYVDCLKTVMENLGDVIDSLDYVYQNCPFCDYQGDFEELGNGEGCCPSCKSTSFDIALVGFFDSARLKEAREGFKVVNLAHKELIGSWMTYYCPQVQYVGIDIKIESIPDGDIIVSDTLVEKEGYYTHQLNYDEDKAVYLLSRDMEDKFDYSYSWEPSGDLIENGPLVSVILPCYNHEQFVEEAILSVINQSYKNIEFLVADDGSTDRTPEIMKKYEKYYTKSMYFKENAFGRMMELKACVTGKYVAIMHSDDLWHKDKIAMQVEYLEAHPECGACLTWCRNIDQHGNELPDQLFIQPNRGREEWMRFFWENGNALCNPSTLTKKELFYNKIWQGTTGRQLPDFFKWIDMVQHYPIHIVTKELTYMRRYQLEGVENTSIESGANSINVHIEMGVNWPFCLRDMADDFFVNTFRDKFINKDASTRSELLCEKYFLLLNHISPFVQNGALYFFNDFYIEMKDCLKEKYNYAIKEYRADARTKGLMDFLKGIAY